MKTLKEEREAIVEEFSTEIFPPINIGYDGGYLDAQHRDKYINWLHTALLSHEEKVVARVREEVEELWHELGKYQGWLGGVMGNETDSTLMVHPPTKEVREAKALHTAIILKAKEKVHQTQMKMKSLLDNLK